MMNTQPNNARRATFQAAQRDAAEKRNDIDRYIAARTRLVQQKAKA